jgi:hypothetical protein
MLESSFSEIFLGVLAEIVMEAARRIVREVRASTASAHRL